MASLIRSELAKVLIEDVSDPRLKDVVITEVELSTDLRNARVFFARGTSDLKEVDRGFKRAVPFLKRKLGEDLDLRYIPDLEFKVDTQGESINRLMSLFEDIKKD
jgi:ribosome-binding factor A